ncbi:galactose-proton symporter-like [Haematobia irritans]|uniref:galactose-proton symporter-like n=1 Tax=Haematobia irritans TaxID=7368 RepID=UPI003F4F639B
MSKTTKQTPSPPAVINVPEPLSEFKWNAQQHAPQPYATLSGSMIFASAGMNMAMGLGWAEVSPYTLLSHFCYSWFIGVIIGTILAVPLRKFIPKKWIIVAAALFVLIGGLLFTSVPYNYDALLAARYINGIATGLVTVTFLIHASEISVDFSRGKCLVNEQYFITLGVVLQMMFASDWSSTISMPVHRIHGVLDILFAILSGILLKLFIESPIDELRKGNEAGALNCLARLQRPEGVTSYTYLVLEQHKAYVRDQENLTLGESFKQGLLPLFKMLIFRSLTLAFFYSLPLNFVLRYSILLNGKGYIPAIAGVCRFIATAIPYAMIDSKNRKLPSTIAIVILGGLLIGEATLFLNLRDMLNTSGLYTAMILYIVIQAVFGFFAPYTSAYMGEAFPLQAKPYLLAICVIAEQIIQIILIETFKLPPGNGLLVEGIITVIFGLLLMLIMPETRNTSLTEAQRRFRSFLYMKTK